MSDQDTKVVKIEWTTTESHSGYFRVPKDFEHDDYNLEDALADHDEDTFDGCEREEVNVYNQGPPPGWRDEIPELDLEGYEVDR